MKKILVFLLIVIICFSLVACSRSRGAATSDFSNFQNEVTSAPSSNTTEVGSSTSESVLMEEPGMEEPGIVDCVSVSQSVTVKRCEYDYKNAENKTNVKIYYPQIDGMVDLDIQTQINTLLEEEGLNDYSNRWNIENLTLEVDYSIVYINEKYMSVKFYGTGDADSYPTNLGYAINIDLSTGDRIRLEEIVDIDGFLKILSSGKGYLEIENDFILEDYTYQDLTKQYQNDDKDDKDELAVPGYNTFYFTADKLGIYIYIPHAFGDYRTIEVDFKDIRSDIRNNDIFWKSISDMEKEDFPDKNKYFFSDEDLITYKTRFSFLEEELLPQEIDLSINEILKFKQGILYELKIDFDGDFTGRTYYDWDRFHLGYFYVQEDKILLLRGENILNEITSEEDILSIGKIVCQEEELKDSLNEDQKGEHEYISINENQRQYHSYNNLVESGFYEAFVWEQNRGLVSYWSGFGAVKDGIELYLESED